MPPPVCERPGGEWKSGAKRSTDRCHFFIARVHDSRPIHDILHSLCGYLIGTAVSFEQRPICETALTLGGLRGCRERRPTHGEACARDCQGVPDRRARNRLASAIVHAIAVSADLVRAEFRCPAHVMPRPSVQVLRSGTPDPSQADIPPPPARTPTSPFSVNRYSQHIRSTSAPPAHADSSPHPSRARPRPRGNARPAATAKWAGSTPPSARARRRRTACAAVRHTHRRRRAECAMSGSARALSRTPRPPGDTCAAV